MARESSLNPLRDRHIRRLEALKTERNNWESHWQELADFVAPDRYRKTARDTSKIGKKTRGSIIDPSASLALRILKSGMHSGITSPSRPWFRTGTIDPEMQEFGPIKEYMFTVEDRMRQVFATSNMYNVFHAMYGDLAQMGQGVALILKDDWDYIRLVELIHGQFWLGADYSGRVNICYRQCDMTVEQIVNRFAPVLGSMAKLPQTIRNAYDTSNYDAWHSVYNAIEPRRDRDPTKLDRQNKAFMSNYWMDGMGSETDLLEESGYDYNPILAPRWEVVGSDTYGISPGMEALPDVKMLQIQQKRMAEAIDKMVRPPMTGPTSLKNQPKSLAPGSVTYVDATGGQSYQPAMQVTLRISELEEKIQQTTQRIDRTYFADLFQMLQNLEGVQPRNQLELSQRNEEKLLNLGPVLERVYNELLRPTIAVTYAIMNEARILPPPPQELQGKTLKVDFVSTLAQAQKAVATGSIERLFGFLGNLAGAKPEIMDKADFDEAADVYGDLVGIPPSIIVPDDEVKKIRESRAQQQQAAMATEAAAKLAPAAKDGAQAAQLMAQTDAAGTGGGADVGSLLSSLGLAS